MLTTTTIVLLGVAFEAEYAVHYGDPSVGVPETLEICSAYILGAYPEGIESSSKKSNSVYLNYRCDLEYLTIEEFDTLENSCWSHYRKVQEEAWDV
jgi:hypothetical protein